MTSFIIDATALDLYPVGKPGFSAGSELYTHELAKGLAKRGHLVHVVTHDLEQEKQRGPTLFYWPRQAHPTHADVVVCMHDLRNLDPYAADTLILASNSASGNPFSRPDFGPNDEFLSGVDAVTCQSQYHANLLGATYPQVKDKCYVTGHGVTLEDYDPHVEKVPGRLLWSSDPQRGLWHMLNIFERVQDAIPDAILDVTYDFERQFNYQKYSASALSEILWYCRDRMRLMRGVRQHKALSREDIVRLQQECHVFAYPCDPLEKGTELFCLSALEAAAAGCPLVLSTTECLPEVFAGVADFIPIVGAFDPNIDRRWDAWDWGDHIVRLMQDDQAWAITHQASLEFAAARSWSRMIDRWERMLAHVREKEPTYA